MAQGEDLCELSRAKHKDQYLADVVPGTQWLFVLATNEK